MPGQAQAASSRQLEYLATARGRVGYGIGSWTPFLTSGVPLGWPRCSRAEFQPAWCNGEADPRGLRRRRRRRSCAEPSWSARFEYLYTNLGATSFQFNSGAR